MTVPRLITRQSVRLWQGRHHLNAKITHRGLGLPMPYHKLYRSQAACTAVDAVSPSLMRQPSRVERSLETRSSAVAVLDQ
jgi:hypothetical protein